MASGHQLALRLKQFITTKMWDSPPTAHRPPPCVGGKLAMSTVVERSIVTAPAREFAREWSEMQCNAMGKG
jgi:hypothetical protein